MRTGTLFAVTLLATFIACTKDDKPSLCGGQKTFDLSRPNAFLFYNGDSSFTSYLDGNNRVFQWSALLENVCPDEHVKVNYQVVAKTGTQPILARGSISWNFFFETQIAMPWDANALSFVGNGEAGLKQAFNDDPAWFVPQVEVFFPSQGSYSTDSAFLSQHISGVFLSGTFWDYNP